MSGAIASVADLRAVPAGVRRYRDLALPVSKLMVRVRSLTDREIRKYQSDSADVKGKRSRVADAAARLFVLCLCDCDGNPILSDTDAAMFQDWDAADTMHLESECLAHTGLLREARKDLGKNSEKTDD